MTKFLDGSDEAGFIYISFGSYAQITRLPLESQQIIYEVLKSFSKIRFIWKWEGERPLGMPDNVFTAKWIPQQTLLGKHTFLYAWFCQFKISLAAFISSKHNILTITMYFL